MLGENGWVTVRGVAGGVYIKYLKREWNEKKVWKKYFIKGGKFGKGVGVLKKREVWPL